MEFGGWFNVKETTASSIYRREGEEPRDLRPTMEGEQRSQRSISLLLVMLFVFSLFPGVQAQDGEVLFEVASFSVEDYASFEGESLAFTVELNELSGGSSNVSLTLVVETMEGAVLSNTTQPLSVFQPLEVRNISGVFDNLPFGFSTVSLSLDGDVGSNSSTHQSMLSRTVQRLRPLAITLGGVSSVVANPVDQAGQPTGNLTLQDGDSLEVSLPIINNGDVNWTGGIELHLVNEGLYETVVFDNITVNASTSQSVSLLPTMRLVEGDLDWSIQLNNTTNSQPGVHALNGSWTVGPPPLPLLDGYIVSDAEAVQAGEVLTSTVWVWNNGSVPYSGSVVCTADGSEVFNTSSVLLEPSTNASWSFSLAAKPLVIVCDASGARVSALSSTPFELIVDMPSAVFQSAGATTPSYSGGPWHKGDTVQANLLMRNIGDLDGRVRLVLSSGAATSQGDWVEMKQGAAGEISASFQFLQAGQTALTWMLESDDGVFMGMDNGTTLFVVQQQQSVGITFADVSRGENAQLTVNLTLDLDEGKDREVRLQVGYELGGSTVYLLENDLFLQQGQHDVAMVFGDLKADRLVAQVSPVDWLIGPGPLAATSSLPAVDTQFWLELSPTTTPIRPIEGNDATVRLTFHQSGPALDMTGEVWLMDAYGTRLAKVMSPAWGDQSNVALDITLVWPEGSNVAIQALWHVEGTIVTAEASYVSGEEAVESSTDWPVGAMLWGVALGASVALVLRLRARKAHVSEAEAVAKPTRISSTQASPVKKQEKREVSCPECNRRLRVPVDYAGSVGCPDCSHKFNVEPEQVDEPVEDEDDLEVEVQPETPSPVADKIEISCPDCLQSLRIPSSYKGSVRCPACTKIFKAYEGDV